MTSVQGGERTRVFTPLIKDRPRVHLSHSCYTLHTRPPPDPEWKERGAKMLKMMGWSEGQGLGRQKDGITAPIETCVQSGKSGLGLAAELSDKAAERFVEKLRVGLSDTADAEDRQPKSDHVHGL